MRLESRKYLFDVSVAIERVVEFTANKSFAEYVQSPMLKAAVERQFEIIGEALSQLSKCDAELANLIPEHRRIIAFRNVLIHGYADVDDRLVWSVVEAYVPDLRAAIARMLSP